MSVCQFAFAMYNSSNYAVMCRKQQFSRHAITLCCSDVYSIAAHVLTYPSQDLLLHSPDVASTVLTTTISVLFTGAVNSIYGV
jgi:hypothetical protein